ncbi:MAG: polyprenyl synthetase [Planctomycetes bacterium]|nr:polyprenyl synthetase [Planctomycetota bacterium]
MPAMKSSREALSVLLEPVADGMERMRAVLAAQLQETSPAVSDMTEHVRRFRGKGLRAALVLLVGEATGNTTDEHASVAAIVEMIHLATLVHDDILDGATVRRRVACVNERWDNQTAVLLGDFLYARAFALSTDLSSRLASRLLAETTRGICVGEIEQSTRRYDFELAQTTYEKIASAKTGILYGTACTLGARYPGGNEIVGDAMETFGNRLGLAFQIIDDCLDLTASTQGLGKSVGTDVEDGKITLPVLRVYSHADEDQRAAIRDVYTRPGLTDRAARLREVCDLEPGLVYARNRARTLLHAALKNLKNLPDTPARGALFGMAEFVSERGF